jgi:hypothetical protein
VKFAELLMPGITALLERVLRLSNAQLDALFLRTQVLSEADFSALALKYAGLSLLNTNDNFALLFCRLNVIATNGDN